MKHKSAIKTSVQSATLMQTSNCSSAQQFQNKTTEPFTPTKLAHSLNKYQFVAYEYRSNAILVHPLKDQTNKSLTTAFLQQSSQKYIRSTKADIQLVNPDDHRVNAAEHAIQTWKEHWLSGMGTLDPNSPIQLWCQFIEQGQGTLNLLRVSRVNPKLSAYAVLDGQFNFDKTPLAPVSTRALILLDPNSRKTWQNHALDAWYIGPAKNHYHNYRFFIPSTKGYRISESAKFFPKHTKMPAIEPGDTIRLAAQDLITAISTFSTAPITLAPQHTRALRRLADIFAATTSVTEHQQTKNNTPVTRVTAPTPPPRVTTPSSSADPTDPTKLGTQRYKQHTHADPTRRMSTDLSTAHTNVFTPTKHSTENPSFVFDAHLEHVCNGVVHPVTKETITKYEKLANDPLMQEVWTKAMCKELGSLAQGWDDSTGTDTIFLCHTKKSRKFQETEQSLTPGLS
eukprot:CCRYP_009400-RA/>CCRYP_009400-RA protein AED:0.36 eAED:0.34 QI:0/0/0/1/0/0/4/0/453